MEIKIYMTIDELRKAKKLDAYCKMFHVSGEKLREPIILTLAHADKLGISIPQLEQSTPPARVSRRKIVTN